MSTPDAVERLLLARGCPPHIVAAGLAGLVDVWSEIVVAIEGGYALRSTILAVLLPLPL